MCNRAKYFEYFRLYFRIPSSIFFTKHIIPHFNNPKATPFLYDEKSKYWRKIFYSNTWNIGSFNHYKEAGPYGIIYSGL